MLTIVHQLKQYIGISGVLERKDQFKVMKNDEFYYCTLHFFGILFFSDSLRCTDESPGS